MNLHEFRRLLETTFLLHVSLLILLAFVLAWQIDRTLEEQRLVDHSDRISAELNQTERLIVDEGTGLRDYQITHNQSLLIPFNAAEAPLRQGFDRLDHLLRDDPTQERELKELSENHALWIELAQEVLARQKSDKHRVGNTAMYHQRRALLRAMRVQIQSMSLVERRLRSDEASAAQRRVRSLVTLLLASSIGVGLLLGFLTQRNLKRVSLAYRSSLDEASRRADKLFESEQRLQTTLESIGDALIACDGGDRIQLLNRVAESLTGWDLDVAKGKPLDEVFCAAVAGPDGHAVWGADSDRIAGLLPRNGIATPCVLIAKNGAEHRIEATAAPIRDTQGEVAGSVLVFHDVTEMRQKEAALLANEKLAVAGRLAASIAHEIHNPLDSIANLIHLLKDEADPLERQRYLGLAEQQLDRTLQISRSMLGFYREPRAPVAVNLGELLDSVLLLLDRRLKDQSIALERNFSPRVVVQGFPGELQQVLTNLINNAAEAAGPSGRVQVILEHAPSADGPNGASIAVQDSGPGISAEIREKLFRPFFTTKGQQGTGLGLWVSKGIVERHGGRLEMTNSGERGLGGAVVRVFLPAVCPAPSPLQMAEA